MFARFATSAIDQLRYNDWTFSDTAEWVVAFLLVMVLVITTLNLQVMP